MPDDKLADLAPPKYLPREEWSAEETFKFALNGKPPINPEWETYRREVLAEHGLLDERGGE
jgi:hypothetical protein